MFCFSVETGSGTGPPEGQTSPSVLESTSVKYVTLECWMTRCEERVIGCFSLSSLFWSRPLKRVRKTDLNDLTFSVSQKPPHEKDTFPFNNQYPLLSTFAEIKEDCKNFMISTV